MILRLFVIASFVLVTLFSCQKPVNQQDAGDKESMVKRPDHPYAELYVPNNVDMGIFEGDDLIRTTTLQLSNFGNDTLYIVGVHPDCNCTQILRYDSVVPPQANKSLTVQLDLTDYPADTIRKEFGIISNDFSKQVTYVTVFGVRK